MEGEGPASGDVGLLWPLCTQQLMIATGKVKERAQCLDQWRNIVDGYRGVCVWLCSGTTYLQSRHRLDLSCGLGLGDPELSYTLPCCLSEPKKTLKWGLRPTCLICYHPSYSEVNEGHTVDVPISSLGLHGGLFDPMPLKATYGSPRRKRSEEKKTGKSRKHGALLSKQRSSWSVGERREWRHAQP